MSIPEGSAVNRVKDWWIPNKTFEVSKLPQSLMMGEVYMYIDCNETRQVTFILMLESDWNNCLFQKSTWCNIVVRLKACETVSIGGRAESLVLILLYLHVQTNIRMVSSANMVC